MILAPCQVSSCVLLFSRLYLCIDAASIAALAAGELLDAITQSSPHGAEEVNLHQPWRFLVSV